RKITKNCINNKANIGKPYAAYLQILRIFLVNQPYQAGIGFNGHHAKSIYGRAITPVARGTQIDPDRAGPHAGPVSQLPESDRTKPAALDHVGPAPFERSVQDGRQ